MGRFKSGIN
jgi:hypothetical protein